MAADSKPVVERKWIGKTISSEPDWTVMDFLTYLVLAENSAPESVEGKLAKYKEFIKIQNINELEFELQPVSKIYLGSQECIQNGNMHVRVQLIHRARLEPWPEHHAHHLI